MPEGPELAHSRDHLRRTFLGHRIEVPFMAPTGRYARREPAGFDDFLNALATDTYVISSIDVKGKFMWWTLLSCTGSRPWYVWITYGMSGQFSTTPGDHAAYGFELVDNDGNVSVLYFLDPRRFGTLKFVDDTALHAKKLASLGPDMLAEPPDVDGFRRALMRRPNATLAEALMDQSVISGVGNYVKAESLYAARLSPNDLVRDLGDAAVAQLREAIVDVLQRSYALHGASLHTYRDVSGEKGAASQRFMVYGRRYDPYGNKVVREVTADGRTTHWVPVVQSKKETNPQLTNTSQGES